LFISTAGVGVVPDGLELSAENARVGDRVLISGTLGDHGVAIMSKRQNIDFETEIVSDSASLNSLVANMVEAGGRSIRLMRDPTRGGLAATLTEIAQQSSLGFHLIEEAIPVKPGVAAACE
ncbi:AIR synthase-related protein, partial [Acinetobacter baumannii]